MVLKKKKSSCPAAYCNDLLHLEKETKNKSRVRDVLLDFNSLEQQHSTWQAISTWSRSFTGYVSDEKSESYKSHIP